MRQRLVSARRGRRRHHEQIQPRSSSRIRSITSNFAFQHWSIDDTTIFGVGVGYEFNNWFRSDVTAEYRTKAAVNAFGLFSIRRPRRSATPIPARSGPRSFLANGYIDLGTWNCLTPFIGAGVGVAFNTLTDFVDTGIGIGGGFGIGQNPTETHLAWALHAGLSYAVTQNFTVELAYRYLNYGSITDTINCIGSCHPDSYKLDNLTSNDSCSAALAVPARHRQSWCRRRRCSTRG